MSPPHHPDAVAPDRQRFVASRGAKIRLHEWGDPGAPPLLCCHGFIDHGRGFDRLAPLLADRFHVVAMDARGHGDSDWSDTYLWALDVRDVVEVMMQLGPKVHLLGHSRGGGQVTEAALLAPERVGGLVNLDGFGPPDDDGFRPPGAPDLANLDTAQRCTVFLDRRRRAHERTAWRPYPTFEDLVARRGQQNPLLEKDWLRYFVYHAAREAEDGWRWKADPMMVAGGFGPFRPDWIAPNWKRLKTTMLAVIGSEEDTWGPLPEPLLAQRLAHAPRVERATIEGSGHFIHMERPAELASLVRDFLEAA